MRRFFRELAYDLLEPGIHIRIIPCVAFVFVLLSFFVQRNLNTTGRLNTVTLRLLEMVIPFLGGYGTIMLMQGILDTEGGEIVFTYNRTNLYWGLFREMRFLAVFIMLVTGVCEAIAAIMKIDVMAFLPLTIFQCFAVMGISFLGVAASRQTAVGLIVLVGFVGIQLTLGKEYNVLNFIYLLDGYVPDEVQASHLIFQSLIFGCFGWGLGQVWLRPSCIHGG